MTDGERPPGRQPRRAASPPAYRILGIDPGTRIVGWAVLELDERRRHAVVIEHGVLRLGSTTELAHRLREIYTSIGELADEYAPQVVVVEDVFYGKNFKSALRIGESRGVVFAAAAMVELEIVQYPPATVKQAICGNGGASKEQVKRMVQRHLDLAEQPEPDDAADALAIALCHARRLRGSTVESAGQRRKRSGSGRSLQALADRLNKPREE